MLNQIDMALAQLNDIRAKLAAVDDERLAAEQALAQAQAEAAKITALRASMRDALAAILAQLQEG